MNLKKIYKNTFLVIILSFVLSACAQQQKTATKVDTQIRDDV